MSAVKRTLESDNGSESKKIHVEEPKIDDRDKGYAPIKPEYIIESTQSSEVYYNDDEAEGGDREEMPSENTNTGKKKRKQRGQNKNRDLKQEHGAMRLCSALIDPQNEQECKFGAEKCKSTHDIEQFLASKGPDIEGTCPVFNAIGYCPAGLKCRWLSSHFDKPNNALLRDEDKVKLYQLEEPHELNRITPDKKFALQKKKYNFEKSELIIKYLDSLVQSEENLKAMEERKDNQAAYTEAAFKPGEKKKLNLKNAKIVSPLTTVGNLPYRRLMKTLGADVTYCEMALTVPLLQGTNAEWALPKAHKSEYPGFGVQFAAGKHWSATKAAEAIYNESTGVSELNLNCGCPIDLLYRQGQGSALMDLPSKLMRILKGMNLASGDIPVTVKIRTGTRDNKSTAKTLVSRLLQENDVAAITLHGRSRQQRYTREADWGYIGEVGQIVEEFNNKKEDDKESSDVQRTQFVGNGDVYTFEDWYKATSTPGIDSVMVARGALIKPWIFEEVEAQQYLDKSATERLEILRNYANFAVEHWGTDEYGIGLARRYMCEFLSFFHRYIPVGILERLPPKLNQRPPTWKGRDDLETLLGSGDYKDWIKITEMFFGKAGDNFHFTPKHKSNSYEKQ